MPSNSLGKPLTAQFFPSMNNAGKLSLSIAGIVNTVTGDFTLTDGSSNLEPVPGSQYTTAVGSLGTAPITDDVFATLLEHPTSVSKQTDGTLQLKGQGAVLTLRLVNRNTPRECCRFG
jgi:hypothetical protein